MNYIKRIFKFIFILAGIICMIFSLFQISKQFGNGYIDDAVLFDEPESIYNSRAYFSDNKYLYTCNEQTAQVQIFSEQGEFIKGFSLPSKGGAIWSGINEENAMIVYCVRSNYEIIFSGEEWVANKNIFFNSPEDFYKTERIDNKYLCKLKDNTIYTHDGNNDNKISINAPYTGISLELCILLFFISIMCIMIPTGLLKKMLQISSDITGKQTNRRIKYGG